MILLNEEQYNIVQKCANDVVFFLEEFGYIQHPKYGRLPLKGNMFEWQKKLLRDLASGESVILLKSRQVGATTIVAGFVLWLACFHLNKNCDLLSDKEEKAISLLDKVRYFANNCPSWLIGEIGTDSRLKMEFVFRDDNPESNTYGQIIGRSVIRSLSTASNVPRGSSPSFLLCDEMAFWPPHVAEKLWTSLVPATAHGGQLLICSTPATNTIFEQLYFETLEKIERNEPTRYVIHRVHYRYDCGYDDAWLARASEGLTEEQRMQEFELMFMPLGQPAFYLPALQQCYKPGFKPSLSNMYFSGIDTAEGKSSGDYNAAVVINDRGEVVEVIRNKYPLGVWAGTIVNGVLQPGFVSKLHEKYPGIMQIEYMGAGIQVYNMHVLPPNPVCQVIPKRVTMKSKQQLVNQFILAIEGGSIVFGDEVLFNELRSMVKDGNGGACAPSGGHDDVAMAAFHAFDAFLTYGGVSTGIAFNHITTEDKYNFEEPILYTEGPINYSKRVDHESEFIRYDRESFFNII